MSGDATTSEEPRQPSRQTLPRSARIRSRAEFDRVFKARNAASDAVLTVHVARTQLGQARLGISAGRRLGNAVVRNRLKRLVREAFRRHRSELPPGTDWVVVPRRAAVSFRQVEDSFRQLTTRLMERAADDRNTPASPTARAQPVKAKDCGARGCAQKESTECLGGEPGAFRRGKKPN